MLPFLYNFLEQLKEQGIVEYTFKQDVKNSGSVVKEAVKEATKSVFDIDRFLESTKNLCSGDSFRISGNTLKEYHEMQAIITNFKDNLSKLIEDKMKGKNIYIFVDELERCRPTFAIELLEGIKHIFNIKGLVFILGIDRNQLKHTVSTMYGQGMDDAGYLRKFIDLELSLSEPKISEYTKFLSENMNIKNAESIKQENFLKGEDYFTGIFNIIGKSYKLTLREIEQIYTEFNVLAKILPAKDVLVTPLLAFMLILKSKDFDFYSQIGKEINTFEQVNHYFEDKINPQIRSISYENNLYWRRFNSILYGCCHTYEEMQKITNEYTDKIIKNPTNRQINIEATFYDEAFNAHTQIQQTTKTKGFEVFEYLRKKITYTQM